MRCGCLVGGKSSVHGRGGLVVGGASMKLFRRSAGKPELPSGSGKCCESSEKRGVGANETNTALIGNLSTLLAEIK